MPYLSALDFRILDFGVHFKLGKKSSSKPTRFYFKFEIGIFFPSYLARVALIKIFLASSSTFFPLHRGGTYQFYVPSISEVKTVN